MKLKSMHGYFDKPFNVKVEMFQKGSGKFINATFKYDPKNFIFNVVTEKGDKLKIRERELVEFINSGQYKIIDNNMKLKEYIQQEVKKQLLEVSVDDYEEDHNLEILIYSYLSDIQESNNSLRQMINFIKSLVSELADGKKRLSDKEVKKLYDKYL